MAPPLRRVEGGAAAPAALALSKVEYETHDEVARAAFLFVPEEPPEGAAA